MRALVLLVSTILVLSAGCRSGQESPGPARLSLEDFVAGLAPDTRWPSLTAGKSVSEDMIEREGARIAGWSYRGASGDLVSLASVADGSRPRLFLADSTQGVLHVLDASSRGPSDSTSLAYELPRDGTYFVIAAAAQGRGQVSVKLEVEPLPAFRAQGDPRDAYALLVGIGDYPGQEHDLPGVPTDLDRMQKLLVETFGWRPENVLVLRDKHATRRRLMSAFLGHLGRAGSEGTALFYYSGHGRQLMQNTGLMGVLDPEPDGRDEALYLGDGGILLDDELGSLADRLKARHALLILDSCYSGTGSRGQGVWLKRVREDGNLSPLPTHFETLAPDSIGEGRTIEDVDSDRHLLLAAAAEDQPAGVISDLPGLPPPGVASAFTYHLTRLLESNPENLTFRGLMDSLREQTRKTTAWSDVPEQSPQIHGALADEPVKKILQRKP